MHRNQKSQYISYYKYKKIKMKFLNNFHRLKEKYIYMTSAYKINQT